MLSVVYSDKQAINFRKSVSIRAPKRPGKEQPSQDIKEGKRGLEGEGGANGEGKGGGVQQGGAVMVPGVRRAAAVTAFRLEDGQYKVSTTPVPGGPETNLTS